jgi:hypothetical protein
VSDTGKKYDTLLDGVENKVPNPPHQKKEDFSYREGVVLSLFSFFRAGQDVSEVDFLGG